MLQDRYDVAQICQNGHVINSTVRSFPEFSADYCHKCGAPAMVNCPSCDAPTRGEYMDGGISLASFPAPDYCASCGKAFPWKDKKLRLAKELIAELELKPEDEEALDRAFDGLSRSSGEVDEELYARRIARVMGRVKAAAAAAIYKAAIDLGSETIKKILTERW